MRLLSSLLWLGSERAAWPEPPHIWFPSPQPLPRQLPSLQVDCMRCQHAGGVGFQRQFLFGLAGPAQSNGVGWGGASQSKLGGTIIACMQSTRAACPAWEHSAAWTELETPSLGWRLFDIALTLNLLSQASLPERHCQRGIASMTLPARHCQRGAASADCYSGTARVALPAQLCRRPGPLDRILGGSNDPSCFVSPPQCCLVYLLAPSVIHAYQVTPGSSCGGQCYPSMRCMPCIQAPLGSRTGLWPA